MNSQAGRYSSESFARGLLGPPSSLDAQTEEHTHMAWFSRGGQDRVWEPFGQEGELIYVTWLKVSAQTLL